MEGYAPVEPAVRDAMAWAEEIGLRPVQPAAGAALCLLAAASRARTVVEIGTGTGVSGVWLLRGMRPDGVLTTIDVEPEHQRLARGAFRQAGFPASRARMISGRALDVLPRLADGAYDMVFTDATIGEYAPCVAAAYRLLRDGGLLVLHRALGADGRVADPTARDPDSVALREVLRYLRDAEEWLPSLLRTGEGLLCAVKR